MSKSAYTPRNETEKNCALCACVLLLFSIRTSINGLRFAISYKIIAQQISLSISILRVLRCGRDYSTLPKINFICNVFQTVKQTVMSTESDECYVDECRTSKDDDTEHNLIIDTEETSAASTPLSAKIVCTSDGTVFVAEPEHRQFLSLLPQSDIIAKNELWPRIRQLYHSTSTDSVVSVYKPVDCNQLFSKANEKSPVYCNHLVNERLLICFVCNLSFSSTLSFLCHIKEPPHSVQLSTDERQIVIFEPSVSVVLQSFDNSSLDNNCVVSILVKDGEKSWENFASGSSSSFCADEITTTNYANSEFTSSTIEQTGQPSLAAYCSLHPEGKSAGVECPKCDLILGSSRSLGGHMTMMHSRNSCKTLKCPKCNWHYKYQETLEIHMKEKHSDAPTTCPYCVSNIPHPRLGRGEQWSCGYKYTNNKKNASCLLHKFPYCFLF